MDKNIVYHGSNVEVPFPRILQNGFYKDFGYGFYCTLFKKQAKRWAMTKKGESVVNLYEYVPNTDLNILKFNEMCEEWLDFIVSCRNGIEHNYDIVEGPMADDTIWNFVNEYLSGNISREVFWEYAKFKYPTHQMSFHSLKALDCLKFERSEQIHG